jgi:hypothetical protein
MPDGTTLVILAAPPPGGEAGVVACLDYTAVVQDDDLVGVVLFYSACMEVAGRLGLHVAPIRLTPRSDPRQAQTVAPRPVRDH